MSNSQIYMSPPHLSGREQETIADVLASGWVAPAGPHLTQFEEAVAKRTGVGHAVAVTTGTAAIHLTLRYLDLEPDDEVICPTFTFCASANPILYERATPVFIDSDRVSWNMDPNLLEEELDQCARRGRLPKAVISVDILGQSADMDAIQEAASKYEIRVIQDAAESLGGTYKGRPVGSTAWASIFSFNGNKIITTSGGGMICSNDAQLIDHARFLATQARDPLPHYEHSTLGFNYRMSNVLAAVGLAQLEVLDDRVLARRRIFEFYKERLGKLPGIDFVPEAPFAGWNCWLTAIQVDVAQFGTGPQQICELLQQQNIEARPVWKPLHRQPLYAGCRCRGGAVADHLFETALCLPSGSAMTDDDLDRVCAAVENVAK